MYIRVYKDVSEGKNISNANFPVHLHNIVVKDLKSKK